MTHRKPDFIHSSPRSERCGVAIEELSRRSRVRSARVRVRRYPLRPPVLSPRSLVSRPPSASTRRVEADGGGDGCGYRPDASGCRPCVLVASAVCRWAGWAGRLVRRPAARLLRVLPGPGAAAPFLSPVSGPFSAASPSLPNSSSGERGRRARNSTKRGGQNAPTRTAARRHPGPRTRRPAGRRTKRPAQPAHRQTAGATRPQLGRKGRTIGTQAPTFAHVAA